MTTVIPSRPARPIRVDGGGRIPAGGSTGQALVKSSGNDYETEWAAPPSASWGGIIGTLAAQTDLQAALDAKQATLISGTNIKTLNGSTILGSGDIVISGVSDGDKGDVTVTGSGANWTIDNGAVTVAKMQTVATATMLGRSTAGSGAVEVLSSLPVGLMTDNAHGIRAGGTLHNAATTVLNGFMSAADKTKLDAITGTNTGDQTTIVGITGTKAQFDTAVTDGNFLYVGDVTSNATHTGDATGATALTLATVNANVGSFGSATQVMTQTVNAKGLTTAAANVSIAIPASQVTDFSEAVDDRVAALVVAGTNMTITYNDGAGTLTFDAAGGGAGTDLGYTASTRLLTSSTGADVTLPLVASADAGLAPASGGGTTNFLRADGTWAAPPGGGGVTDGDKGDITVSGSGTVWTVDPLAINAQSGTTYTLVLTDAKATVEMTNASTKTLTIPLNSAVAFPTGSLITIRNLSATAITVSFASGISVSGSTGTVAGPANFSIPAWQTCTLQDTGTDTWAAVVTGAASTGAFDYGLSIAIGAKLFLQ